MDKLIVVLFLMSAFYVIGCMTSSTRRAPRNYHYVNGRRPSRRSIHPILIQRWLRASRRDGVVPPPPDRCQPRCVACDEVNGCTKCRPRTFLYLRNMPRNRQIGICVHDCPEGYYGSRTTNMCRKCEAEHCASCFVHNYCTHCQEGYYLHDAMCVETCPTNMAPNNETKKCEEKVDCVLGAWSSWSECARRSPSRSCKYGRKKRTRVVVQEPTENGEKCGKVKESKKCRTPSNKCPLINVWLRRQIERREKKRKEEERRRKNQKGKKKKNKRNRIRSNDSGGLRSHNEKSKGRKRKGRKNHASKET